MLNLISVLIAAAPNIVDVAKQGQAAWAAFWEQRKRSTDEELNVQLDFLATDFIRIKVIAQAEASN